MTRGQHGGSPLSRFAIIGKKTKGQDKKYHDGKCRCQQLQVLYICYAILCKTVLQTER